MAVAESAADSADAKQPSSISSDKQADNDKQAADNKILTADARLDSIADVPGRLVPEPVEPITPVVATPDPSPVTRVSAEPLPIVPVYATMRDGSERWRRREWLGLDRGPWHRDFRRVVHAPRAFLHAERGEANPLLRPFAGNASMYAAVQVAPTILDFVSRRMMNSSHAWMRNTWWLPQAVSAVVSLSSGVHNMAYIPPAS